MFVESYTVFRENLPTDSAFIPSPFKEEEEGAVDEIRVWGFRRGLEADQIKLLQGAERLGARFCTAAGRVVASRWWLPRAL